MFDNDYRLHQRLEFLTPNQYGHEVGVYGYSLQGYGWYWLRRVLGIFSNREFM